MDSTDNLISNLDSSCKVAERTLSQKLLPSLNRPINGDGMVNAVDILDNFSTCAKQIDAVWNAMKPQFCWSIIIPKDLPPNNFAIIPELLSTYIAPEVSDAIIQPKESAQSDIQLTRDEELELNNLVTKHNEDLSAIVLDFGQAVQSWKAQNMKQRQEKKQQRVRDRRAAAAASMMGNARIPSPAAPTVATKNDNSVVVGVEKKALNAQLTASSVTQSNHNISSTSRKRGVDEVEPSVGSTGNDDTQAPKKMKP